MATTQSRKSSGVTKSGRASARPDDAVSDLIADHHKVQDLFKQYEEAKDDPSKKQKIFQQIDMELKVHTTIEEEIFYPASREFVSDEETVNEAVVEHASAKDLMAQLEGMAPEDPYYDAKVTVLKEMIEHHVEEEEEEYFPEVKDNGMDTKAVGERLMARKQELTASGEARSFK